jgi:hypothetical protein
MGDRQIYDAQTLSSAALINLILEKLCRQGCTQHQQVSSQPAARSLGCSLSRNSGLADERNQHVKQDIDLSFES